MTFTVDEINTTYMDMRKKNRGNENFFTNIKLGNCNEENIIDFKYNDNAMIVLIKENYIVKGYLCYSDVESINELIDEIESPFFVFWNTKDKNEKALEDLDVKLYTIYQRDTVRYDKNPYLEPDTTSRRDILRKMYEPNFGEFASEDDAEELNKLSLMLFDEYSDELPSVDEWRDICKRKECLIYREDNPEENNPIVAYYVWRLEGKKLYSRMSANRSGANILYNLERRIFTDYFDQGIRVFYGWSDIYNVQAHGRRSSSGLNKGPKSVTRLFCRIYTNTDIVKTKNQRGKKCT